MNYQQLLKKIEKNQISPIILLVGEENFLIRESLNSLTRAIVSPEAISFNLETLDAAEISLGKLKEAMATLPFMGGRRLSIVQNFQNFKSSGEPAGLAPYLEKPDPSVVIVFTAPTLPKNKKINALIYKHAEVVELKMLNKNEAAAWITKRADSQGKSIDRAAISYLIQCVGTSLWNLHNEVEKACVYVGERARITPEDVQELVGVMQMESVFVLTDAVGEKNLEKALHVLKNILSHGSPPLAILGMLARQFRLIWQTKSLAEKRTSPQQIARVVGLPPFLVGKCIMQSKKFTHQELHSGFEKMRSLDKKLKSTDIPSKILFENLLFEFCIQPGN